MLMYPRKDLIIGPYIPQDITIQDEDVPSEFAENSHQYQFQQSCLQPPFHYQPNQQFASPPSSAPSSPSFSSPTFSNSYPPTGDSQSLGAPSMTPVSSYNPSFDIQGPASPSSSSYISQYPPYYTPMLAQPPIAASNQGWDSNLQLLSPARIPFHQKQSPSVSRSAPLGHSISPIAAGQHRRSDSNNKPLPTPVQTPLQNSFLAAPFQKYDPLTYDGSSVETESVMRKAILDQQSKHQASPQQQHNDYSLAPSVSSLSHSGNSPVTPQTILDELEDTSKTMTNGERFFPPSEWEDEYLQCDRPPDYNTGNMSMGDELYNPLIMSTPQMSSKPMNQGMLAPRNVIADRLQAAHQGHMSARSLSPVMGMKRDRSPFRQCSPFVGDLNPAALQQAMPTSIPMSQAQAMQMPSNQGQGDLKTMSPKDAVLDFAESEDAAMPPFPPLQQVDFNIGDSLEMRRDSNPMRPITTMDTFPSQYASVHQNPFAFTQQSQRPQHMLQQAPEFTAPGLPHVESNGSDMHSSIELTPQAHAKIPVSANITRPSNTSSNSGTYTCTYHGCTLRFETPAKLQRHKREAHRQTTPGGHLVTRDTSLKNSQAGPHRCDRTNPSTGKPCSSIFSRPYDLTRHEDTIHNARKQKVRCHLCTEEKTFSRNDALTRHMRVVHPEVDWPGKQRRRRD
ncbi:Zinc finger C2H2 [Penicillium taxi]|uniref:Zinc finger C2H2 n=1 Tax=Penicillium taxi TaxID=168475 RepID=UPI00254544FA|nr:Zinc finger C2H2 [Penicillium taxi]KAJ5901882.1 Zinc finger C2H2 [Penicillium taxi]